MVISGGHFKPEALKPKEVVSLLLDDAELECKCKFVECTPRKTDFKRAKNADFLTLRVLLRVKTVKSILILCTINYVFQFSITDFVGDWV